MSLFQNLPIHLINNEGKIVQNNENNFEGNKCGLSKIDSTNLLMNSIGESNEAEDYYQYYNEADPSFVITVAIEDVLLNIGIRENESAGYFVVYLEKNNVLECNYCPSLDTKYKFGNIYNTFESAINSVRNQIDAKTKSEISNFKTDLKVFDWSNKTDNLIYVDLGHCPKCPPYIKYEINSSSHYLEDYRSFVFELFPFMNSIMVNAPH
ncbi:MAG: hypothetical protein K9I99_10675 [Melioribacteraceae bacterium]|nr:hypothetical protein [Melioribacteraceae bacterium]MCF8413787.1 hypothetical protein [Melioribacteraceae bacterium]MCF8431967.1 hypothetical protein [Melioribacteraceae bacterium]